MKRRWLAVSLAAAVLLLAGCSKDYSGVYGGMNALGIPMTVELNKDGTATTNVLGFPVSGSYRVEGSTLTLTVMAYGFSQSITGKIANDTIEFEEVTLKKGVTSIDVDSLFSYGQ
ncbi:MAG: hypothetical protein ACI4ML_04540 [Aristaeellaceae bacterium]